MVIQYGSQRHGDCGVGMITAIEEDIKIIPTSNEAMVDEPKNQAIPKPTAKGIAAFTKESQAISRLNSLKLDSFVCSPAKNMSNTRPIWLIKLIVGLLSISSKPAGPKSIPAAMSAKTHGKRKRSKAPANSTLASSTRKNGKKVIVRSIAATIKPPF